MFYYNIKVIQLVIELALFLTTYTIKCIVAMCTLMVEMVPLKSRNQKK
jgi:hypothetical protein